MWPSIKYSSLVDKIKQIGHVIFKINKSIWLSFVFHVKLSIMVSNINVLTNLPSLDNASITTILWFAIIVGSWTNHHHTKILLLLWKLDHLFILSLWITIKKNVINFNCLNSKYHQKIFNYLKKKE